MEKEKSCLAAALLLSTGLFLVLSKLYDTPFYYVVIAVGFMYVMYQTE